MVYIRCVNLLRTTSEHFINTFEKSLKPVDYWSHIPVSLIVGRARPVIQGPWVRNLVYSFSPPITHTVDSLSVASTHFRNAPILCQMKQEFEIAKFWFNFISKFTTARKIKARF